MTAGTGLPPPGICLLAAGGTKLLAFTMAKPWYWEGLWEHLGMMFLTASGKLFNPTTAKCASGTQCAGHHRDTTAQLTPYLCFGVPPAPFSPWSVP